MARYACAAFAAAFFLGSTNPGRADDLVRLGGSGEADVKSLLFDGQADTEPVYWRGGGYGGYHRPYYRPYYRPYAYRPYAYRPYAYRPYYYGYRPFYRYGYAPYAYTYFTPSYYYYQPSYYDYAPPFYSDYVEPLAGDVNAMPNAVVLGTTQTPGWRVAAPSHSWSSRAGAAPVAPGGTFDYDGGPTQPMPVPSDDQPAPTLEQKRPMVPRDGKLVSITSPPPRVSYPAYGDTSPALARSPAATVPAERPPLVRVSYPAYGQSK